MEKVIFSWQDVAGWPTMYINGKRYRGLISGWVYDRTVCRKSSGSIEITLDELLAED